MDQISNTYLDIYVSVHTVVSTSTIKKCRMEPRQPVTLRILAYKLLKKFILKSTKLRTRHTSIAARTLTVVAAYLWLSRACVYCFMYMYTHQP